jgi:NIMA (never in mitosis gene a)-related kinase
MYCLHTRDIIHRDIKSLNIFLTKDNSAKIGDLGASRRVDHEGNIISVLKSDEKVGTPFYLAPELWNDKPCTKKTDIWALGVLLFELCALVVPFQAEDM